LAIGANSAVFSAIYAVLLRPLPFPDGDELLRLTHTRSGSAETFIAPVRLEEWNRLNTTLQGITGYYMQDVSELSGELPERLREALVAPRFFDVLQVQPQLGRNFAPGEEHFGGPDAILISHRLWQRRFALDPHIIGRTLRLGRSLVPIVGVMPESFQFPQREVDLWSSSPPDAPYAQRRDATWFTAIGRLKPGVTIQQARANLTAVQAELGRQFPPTDAQLTPTVESLKEVTVGSVRNSLWILFASVSLLLLLACTNIGALVLARATNRRHETAIRFSLGASQSAVAAQLLAEVLILAFSGALAGLPIAFGSSAVFRALARNLPRIDEIRLNWNVAAFSFACALAVTLLCGILPALPGARRSLAASLSSGSRSQVSARNPLLLVLAGIQVSLAVILLYGAGLFARGLQQLNRIDPGFDARHVLAFHISTSWNETADFKASFDRTTRLLNGLRSLPGVEAAATAIGLPGVGTDYPIELVSPESPAAFDFKMIAEGRFVTPQYFATMRIPLVAGELCRDRSTIASVIVNRSFVRRYFNGVPPLGRHLAQPANQYIAPAEITGVVADARETGLDREPAPVAYWCSGTAQPGTWFLVRTYGDPAPFASAIRRKIRELEPARAVHDLTSLTDRISDAWAESRLRTILLAFFATAAILLACMGIYGTLSYLVARRRCEMALRLALGAERSQVVGLILNQGLSVAGIGAFAGLFLSALSGKAISGLLYGVTTTDSLTLVSVLALALTAAFLASFFPSIRAARVDPMTTLRED
jgi:putative ABC transport system permease protein